MDLALLPIYARLETTNTLDNEDVHQVFINQWDHQSREDVEQLHKLKQSVVNRLVYHGFLGRFLHYLKTNTQYKKNLPLDFAEMLPLTPAILLEVRQHQYPVAGTQYLRSILMSDIPLNEVEWYIRQYKENFEGNGTPVRGEEHLLFSVWAKYPNAFIRVYNLANEKFRHQLYQHAVHNSALAVHSIFTTDLSADFEKWFVKQTEVFFPGFPWDIDTPAYLMKYQSAIYDQWLTNTRTVLVNDILTDPVAAYEKWHNVELVYHDTHPAKAWPITCAEALAQIQALAKCTTKIALEDELNGYSIFIESLCLTWLRNIPEFANTLLTELTTTDVTLPAEVKTKLPKHILEALKANNALDLDNPRHLQLFLDHQDPKSWFYAQTEARISPAIAAKGWLSYTDDHIRTFLAEQYRSSWPLCPARVQATDWLYDVYRSKKIPDAGTALAVLTLMTPAWRYTNLTLPPREDWSAHAMFNHIHQDPHAAKNFQDYVAGFTALGANFTEQQAFVEFGLQVFHQYKPSLPPPEVDLGQNLGF